MDPDARTPLSLAYSPCPNDAFIFTPWVEGYVAGAPPVRERFEDIDTLNKIALRGEPDVVKVSFHALGHLRDRYYLLRSGGALGRGCGPLVVARTPFERHELATKTVAIPGALTTAALLVRLFAPELRDANITVMPFDKIMPAVCEGRVDAGVIIHESRFTYRDHGLVAVADLGELWEARTALPVPLATICARDDLGHDLEIAAEAAIRASVEHAFAHPAASADYVAAHSQELSPEVCRQHIELYVNEFSIDVGDGGLAAIEALTEHAGAPV